MITFKCLARSFLYQDYCDQHTNLTLVFIDIIEKMVVKNESKHLYPTFLFILEIRD